MSVTVTDESASSMANTACSADNDGSHIHKFTLGMTGSVKDEPLPTVAKVE
jgi:hypothetical protein